MPIDRDANCDRSGRVGPPIYDVAVIETSLPLSVHAPQGARLASTMSMEINASKAKRQAVSPQDAARTRGAPYRYMGWCFAQPAAGCMCALAAITSSSPCQNGIPQCAATIESLKT